MATGSPFLNINQTSQHSQDCKRCAFWTSISLMHSLRHSLTACGALFHSFPYFIRNLGCFPFGSCCSGGGASDVPACLSDCSFCCGRLHICCVAAAAPEAAPSAPVASTAASSGRVVGLPSTSSGVSLEARKSTRSLRPTEQDDCRTPAGGKSVCWRKFCISLWAV